MKGIEVEDFKLGDFAVVGKHEGCKYSGKLMRCTPQIFNGAKYPADNPDEWLWCNGRDKNKRSKNDFDMDTTEHGSHDVTKRCGFSTFTEEMHKMCDSDLLVTHSGRVTRSSDNTLLCSAHHEMKRKVDFLIKHDYDEDEVIESMSAKDIEEVYVKLIHRLAVKASLKLKLEAEDES